MTHAREMLDTHLQEMYIESAGRVPRLGGAV